MLPAIFDRCIREGEVTADNRLVHSTDALEYVLIAKLELGYAYTHEQARVWLLRVTTDTSPGTPDFLDWHCLE